MEKLKWRNYRGKVDLSIKKNILIFGSTGMAGHVITMYLTSLNKYNILNCSRTKLTDETIIIDIFNLEEVKQVIENNQIDIIINCIGVLIKESEDHPDVAIYSNAFFPQFLEQYTKNSAIRIISS